MGVPARRDGWIRLGSDQIVKGNFRLAFLLFLLFLLLLQSFQPLKAFIKASCEDPATISGFLLSERSDPSKSFGDLLLRAEKNAGGACQR